jgi:cell division protein FtsL
MSTFLGQARARALRPVSSLPRPRLTIVPKVASRAPKVPFVALVVTLLLGGLVGLLLLNTSLQRGAYITNDLQRQSDELTVTQERLEQEIADLGASQRVAQKAQQLGMVPNDSPVFLSLADGKVIGKPVAGVAGRKADIRSITVPVKPRTGKVAAVLAGVGASQTSGPVEVAKPKPDPKNRSDRQQDANETGGAQP